MSSAPSLAPDALFGPSENLKKRPRGCVHPCPRSNSVKSWMIVAGALLAATVMLRLPLGLIGIYSACGLVNLFRRPALMHEPGRTFVRLARTP